MGRKFDKAFLLALPGHGLNHTVGDKELDIFDQQILKQSRQARCRYYDDRNGLFSPDTVRPRFLITGGAGFIGSHLVKALRNAGVYASQIKVLDNLWRGRLANLQYDNGSWAIEPTADFCAMDLRNEQDTMRYIRGADYIYHLADIVAGVAYVFSHQEAVFHDNVLINTHTLQASKHNRIPNYIYVGTACSFPKGLQEGPGIHALTEDQTYPAEPESAYGWSKLMGEYAAELAMRPGVFNVGLLRFHNVYGPFSDYSPQSSQAIPSLIRKALQYPSEPYIVWGSGSQYRDFVFVDDIVKALLLVRDKGMNKGVIQLGSKHATTILDLATEVGDIVGKRTKQDIPIAFDVSQPEGDRGRIAAGNRAEQILGWKPNVSLRQGLEATIDWMNLSGMIGSNA
jgi:nucleoside-diphosphate-sugar epimerase